MTKTAPKANLLEETINEGRHDVKPSTFFWSWNDRIPQPDPSMTRTRAARLLWAWRRTSRRPTSMGAYLRSLNRIEAGVYRVVDRASGESATMFIKKG